MVSAWIERAVKDMNENPIFSRATKNKVDRRKGDLIAPDGSGRKFKSRKQLEKWIVSPLNYWKSGLEEGRDFCVCHNGKVFSIEETEEWKDWIPDQCDYPDSHPMQSKEGTKYPPNVVPGYLQVPGYDPLVDRGGYNCRHIIGWIADELAYKYRPELK